MNAWHISVGLGIVLAAASATPVVADEVAIPVGQQAAESDTVKRPSRGIDKAQVATAYGEPLSKHGPVGDPPIYYWEYPGYTVYFEGDTVLHTVLKHQRNASTN